MRQLILVATLLLCGCDDPSIRQVDAATELGDASDPLEDAKAALAELETSLAEFERAKVQAETETLRAIDDNSGEPMHPPYTDADRKAADELEQSGLIAQSTEYCWADYCPCETENPDYGYLDITLCRKLRMGRPVSDAEFDIGASSRDARRALREHRELYGP